MEEAVAGWVGNPEYICHMEQSKISACNACMLSEESGAGAPGKFLKIDLLRLNLEPFQVAIYDDAKTSCSYIVTLIFIYIAFQYTPCGYIATCVGIQTSVLEISSYCRAQTFLEFHRFAS